MRIEQVQEVVDNLDRVVELFEGVDPRMRTVFWEESLVRGVNRSVAVILGRNAIDSSKLKRINDVEKMADELVRLVWEHDGLDKAEGFLVEEMGIREVIGQSARAVVETEKVAPAVEDMMTNWGRSLEDKERIPVLFELMKKTIGILVSVESLAQKISELDQARNLETASRKKKIAVNILRKILELGQTSDLKTVSKNRSIAINILQMMMARANHAKYAGISLYYSIDEVRQDGEIAGYVMMLERSNEIVARRFLY